MGKFAKMAKLTIIAGLPGSGKSTYINSHVYDTLYDDFFVTQPSDDTAKTLDDNKDPLKNARFAELVDELLSGKWVVVSDIMFCIPLHRNTFLSAVLSRAKEVELEFVMFENNPEAATVNVQSRGRADRVEEELKLIGEISERYVPIGLREEKVYAA